MDELPDGYRRIFKLSVIKGLSHKEIANLMGIEPHSSSSQLSRAKMMLRKLLSGYMALMLLVFVISVAIYRYIISKPSQERVKGDIAVKEAEHNDCVPIVRNKMISEKELGEIENKTGKNETMRPAFTYFDVAEIIENSAACIDDRMTRCPRYCCANRPTLHVKRDRCRRRRQGNPPCRSRRRFRV